ncbi:type IV toxin-antitoxin system AbiEi family antitoxin domain-containing protein [Saccharomonospora sp. NPDC006951]
MEAVKALAVLSRFTSQQWGLVTTAQANDAGIDRVTLLRLSEATLLRPVRRGVYAAESAPPSPLHEIQAVWLSLNPPTPAWERTGLDLAGGVVSHVSATQVHGVGDLVADAVELTVPRRRTSRDPAVRLRFPRQRPLAVDDIALVDGLPVTSLARTVVDLLDTHTDGSHLAEVIRDGVESGLLDLATLTPRIGGYARRYGLRSQAGEQLIEHLLDQIGSSITSLAWRFPAQRTAGETVATARSLASALASDPELRGALAEHLTTWRTESS